MSVAAISDARNAADRCRSNCTMFNILRRWTHPSTENQLFYGVEGFSKVTDASGVAVIENVPPGEIKFWAGDILTDRPSFSVKASSISTA